jgi:sRNA-binding regulator protein Hfq
MEQWRREQQGVRVRLLAENGGHCGVELRGMIRGVGDGWICLIDRRDLPSVIFTHAIAAVSLMPARTATGAEVD